MPVLETPRVTRSELNESRVFAPKIELLEPLESESVVNLEERDLVRANKFRDNFSKNALDRLILLGILLADLREVPEETVVRLLDVNPQRLVSFVHGEATVPATTASRWKVLAEIVRNIHNVLRPDAVEQWLRTEIRDLGGKTPLALIEKGKAEAVLQLTKSYLDPSFG
jgi:hypothetical protein